MYATIAELESALSEADTGYVCDPRTGHYYEYRGPSLAGGECIVLYGQHDGRLYWTYPPEVEVVPRDHPGLESCRIVAVLAHVA